jgi:hypothetical protein
MYEEDSKNGASLSLKGLSAGSLAEGTFTGDPERYVKQRSGMGVCFHRGPAFGEHGGGALFLGPLR